MENGKNFPRYTSYAGAGSGAGNGGGTNANGRNDNGNGARRKQRGRPRGQNSNTGGGYGYRNFGEGGAPRFSPPRNPQKVRSFSDKRPRTRNPGPEGNDNEIAHGTTQAFGFSLPLEDSHETFGSQRGRAGKKGNFNMNHLLNFRYGDEPSSRGRMRHDSGRGMGRGRKTSTSSSGHITFNKDHYLLATCQFVVIENIEHQPYLENPDLLIDWSVVEQVRIRLSGDVLVCPICLEVPVAPHITKCGHVYCYGCILHHAASSEKKWANCPICFEMVYVEDLRSSFFQPAPVYSVGDVLEMQLMVSGGAGGMEPQPVEVGPEDGPEDGAIKRDVFQKILTLTNEQILDMIVEPEIDAMEVAKKTADLGETIFLEQAIQAVKERRERLLKGEWENMRKKGDFIQAVESNFVEKVEALQLGIDENDVVVDDWFDRDDELEEKHEDREVDAGIVEESTLSLVNEQVLPSVEKAELEQPKPKKQTTGSSNTVTGEYYFYQSCDGQRIYLHSLNSKCLGFEHGALNCAPKTISGRIVQIDEGIAEDRLRKRCKYLTTLPINCPFKVVELDLKGPHLSDEALENFSEELEHRKILRQKKERYEKRIHRKLQRKEKKNNSTTVIIPSSQVEQKMAAQEASIHDTSTDPIMFPEFNVTVAQSVKPVPDAVAEDEQVTSFAQMLRTGKGKPQPIKAWGDCPSLTKSVATDDDMKMKKTAARKSESDEDGEDNYVPAYKESFSDALSKALDNLDVAGKKEDVHPAAIRENETSLEAQAETDVAGNKKKKKKPKLLFSTSMQSRMK